MKRLRHIFWLLIPLLVLSCGRKEMAERTFYPMGGIPFSVKAYDVPDSKFDEIFEVITTETERLESMLSSYIETSEVSRINREAGGQVSPEMVALLKMSSRLSAETEGAFDVTVGPVLDLWKWAATEGRMPTDEELAQRAAMVDFRQVAVSSGGTVNFKQKNMSIDLGGIAKGYMADAAASIMKKKGIRRGIIDVGGDLVLFNAVGEKPFRVGIKNPIAPDQRLAVILVDSGAVVTSGCYERYLEVGGKQICHIHDPHTGKAVTDLESVTVLAEEAATADAMATALMVLGRKKGQALVRSLPGLEAVLVWRIGDQLEWWISEGLQGKVKIID